METVVIQRATVRPKLDTGPDLGSLETTCVSLGAVLWKLGYAWTPLVLARGARELFLSLGTPCRDALDARYASPWVEEELARLAVLAEAPLNWIPVGTDVTERNRPDAWDDCESFVLTTDVLDSTSPIRAGDTGEPVPLYLLGLGQALCERLRFWMEDYQALDRLWLGTGDIEAAVHGQLTSLDSGLNRRGRDLASQVQKQLGRPVFLYLHQHAGPLDASAPRCPGCDAAWHHPERRSSEGLGRYAYRCDSCGLVANEASEVEDAEEERGGAERAG